MPKIIKNLKKKIIACSTDFFKENPYQDVCMKNIADQLDIAVGTIYNYFPTKWDLYLKIYEKIWDEIYDKLNYETDHIEQGYLKTFFTILYQKMFENKLIVKKIIDYINENNNQNKDRKEAMDKIIFNEIIFTKIYDLFLINLKREYSKIYIQSDQKKLKRLFIIIETSIPTLFEIYPQYQEENIQFFINLTHSYIENNIKNTDNNEQPLV